MVGAAIACGGDVHRFFDGEDVLYGRGYAVNKWFGVQADENHQHAGWQEEEELAPVNVLWPFDAFFNRFVHGALKHIQHIDGSEHYRQPGHKDIYGGKAR